MSKYGNRKTEIDGIVFDSKKESQMYLDLRLMEKAGEIQELVLQPRFPLQHPFTNAAGKKIRSIAYIADFKFYDRKQEKTRVIDCKGFKTAVYRLKKKLFEHTYRELMLEEDI